MLYFLSTSAVSSPLASVGSRLSSARLGREVGERRDVLPQKLNLMVMVKDGVNEGLAVVNLPHYSSVC